MRSRYSAYALRNRDYLLKSWHPLTRPPSLSDKDLSAFLWTSLKVIRASQQSDEGEVEFLASWSLAEGEDSGVHHEQSRFRREGGIWYYLDGEVIGL
jgi:SEC-C motif domain protein